MQGDPGVTATSLVSSGCVCLLFDLTSSSPTDVFQFDEAYEENEEKYKTIKTQLLGDSEASDGDESGSEESDSEAASGADEGTGPTGASGGAHAPVVLCAPLVCELLKV